MITTEILETGNQTERMILQICENIAKAAYEVNRSYCLALGDKSFLPWDKAPDWQKQTNIKGVIFVLENYKTASPERAHLSWLAEKEKEGWKYGTVKDPEKKEHPCYVPYDELPTTQKAKDYIFLAVVKEMLKVYGYPGGIFGQAKRNGPNLK